MFSSLKQGDFVVVCSGKPHFYKERRKVTYVNQSRNLFEIAGEMFDIETGSSRMGYHGATGDRRVLQATPENLEAAVHCEAIKALTGLHLRQLKKMPKGVVIEAAVKLSLLQI